MGDLDKTVNWPVLDTSKFQQGKVDFQKAKAEGFKGVIIRVNDPDTYMGKDPCYERDYTEAKKAGLFVGAYWFTMATTIDYGMEEAKKFADYTDGKQFDLPLYIDLENNKTLAMGMSFCTKLIDSMCTYLQYQRKKFIGVYCSSCIYPTVVSENVRNKFCCWIADYRGYIGYQGNYGIWQYGYAKTSCYPGNIDGDICYVNYPKVIKDRGLNGFPPKLIYEVLADTPIIEGMAEKGKTYQVFGRKTVDGVQYGRITEKGWISLKNCKQK